MYLLKRSPYNEDFILTIVRTEPDIRQVLNELYLDLFDETPKSIEIDFDKLEVVVVGEDGDKSKFYLAKLKEV